MGCGIVSYIFNDPFHKLVLKSNEYDQSHRQLSNSTHWKEPVMGSQLGTVSMESGQEDREEA